MESDETLALSGRALLSSQVFALLGSAPRYIDATVDHAWPITGDVRLDVLIDPDQRTGKDPGAGARNRRGVITAAVFDGVCWKRFDASCLTESRSFANTAQLDGLLRWVCRVINGAKERVCILHSGNDAASSAYTFAPAPPARDEHARPVVVIATEAKAVKP